MDGLNYDIRLKYQINDKEGRLLITVAQSPSLNQSYGHCQHNNHPTLQSQATD